MSSPSPVRIHGGALVSFCDLSERPIPGMRDPAVIRRSSDSPLGIADGRLTPLLAVALVIGSCLTLIPVGIGAALLASKPGAKEASAESSQSLGLSSPSTKR